MPRFEYQQPPFELPAGTREAFIFSKKKARSHKHVERHLRRLFLGREVPETEEARRMVLQMREMVRKGRLWRQANPEVKPNVCFIAKSGITYIGGVDDGIKRGFVTVNDDGLRLLKFMFDWDSTVNHPVNNVPTVTMCKIVVESVFRQST